MINLTASPSEALKLQEGDVCEVDGRSMTVQGAGGDAKKIYLTTTDSRVDEYNRLCDRQHGSGQVQRAEPKYDRYIQHLRHPEYRAVMTRQELRDILVSKTYTIG